MTETSKSTTGPGTRTPDDTGSYGHTPGVDKTSNEGKGTAPIGGPIGTAPYLDPATGQPVDPAAPAGTTPPAGAAPAGIQRPATPAGVTPVQPGVAPTVATPPAR